MVHGFGNSALMWVPFIWALRDRYTFYLPDLPGFGSHRDTLPEPGEGVLEHYAKYLKQVIAETGESKVILVGYSLGSLTSLQLQATGGFGPVKRYLHIDHSPCPKRITGWDGGIHPELWALFEEITAMVDKDRAQALVGLEKLREPLATRYLNLLEILGEKSITLPALRAINSILHRAPVVKTLVAGRASWPWSYAVIQGYLKGEYDFRESIKSLTIPVTVLSGQRSELFGPSAVEIMQKNLPNAKFVKFARSGHDLIFNEPLHFAKVLKDFLS